MLKLQIQNSFRSNPLFRQIEEFQTVLKCLKKESQEISYYKNSSAHFLEKVTDE